MIIDKDDLAALIFAAYCAGVRRSGERLGSEIDAGELTLEEKFIMTVAEWSRAERGPMSRIQSLASCLPAEWKDRGSRRRCQSGAVAPSST
jgi:hypothetical protein